MSEKEMLEIITITEMKNAFVRGIIGWTQSRKGSVSLKRGQQKLPKMKQKEEKDKKTEENI